MIAPGERSKEVGVGFSPVIESKSTRDDAGMIGITHIDAHMKTLIAYRCRYWAIMPQPSRAVGTLDVSRARRSCEQLLHSGAQQR